MKARVVTVSGVTYSFTSSYIVVVWKLGRGGIAIDWVIHRWRFWHKHLRLMYSLATVRSPKVPSVVVVAGPGWVCHRWNFDIPEATDESLRLIYKAHGLCWACHFLFHLLLCSFCSLTALFPEGTVLLRIKICFLCSKDLLPSVIKSDFWANWGKPCLRL